MKNTESMLTKDVIAEFQISKGQMYSITRNNKIPFYKPGGKTIRFKRTDVENYFFSNRIKTAKEIQSEAATIVTIKGLKQN